MEQNDKKNYNQYIKCTVESCQFNNYKQNSCSLDQIQVEPVLGKETQRPDESMCSSYRCNCKDSQMQSSKFFG